MHAIAAVPGSTAPTFVKAPDPPPPEPGQVLCQSLQLGVCGTDREILLSAEPLVPPGEPHLILGHECLARVEAVGPGVTSLCPGDLVAPVVRRALPSAARQRVDLLAFGEFTERGIVHEHGFSQPRWLDLPANLFTVEAALAEFAVLVEPLSVAEKGIHEALAVQRGRLGEECWRETPPRVLVTGQGPIAFAALIGCRARHWPCAMWGRDEPTTYRARLARAWGADYLSAGEESLEMPNVEERGYDLILECTGSDEAMLRAAQTLRSRGVMVWLGSARRPQPRVRNVEALMRTALLRNHAHLGSVNSAPRDFASALRHLAQLLPAHRGEFAALITHRVRPADALWHYEHRAPQGIKAVVMFE